MPPSASHLLIRSLSRATAIVLLVGTLVGCTSMAQVTNLRDQPCQETFATALSDILVEEGEQPERARKVIERSSDLAGTFVYGPRPFMISSQSGTDYSFFVEKKGGQCLLRLYGRQRGFSRYTNNLTYINSRDLSGCQCTE